MRRARGALLAGLAAFIAIQLALGVVFDVPGAGLTDPEYGDKLDRLRARLHESPERPLVLLLGSSRSANGVLPELLVGESAHDARKPLLFNFALTGYGPVQELILLRRLLRRGIVPERVLVEVHPALLHQEPGGYSEEGWLPLDHLERGDLGTLRRYVARPSRWTWNFWRAWLVPAHSQRFHLLSLLAPDWLDFRLRAREHFRATTDGYGWYPYPLDEVTSDVRERATQFARREYRPAFEGFRVTALADRAVRELLELCRREGIAVALFLMPEASNFRGWYPAGARDEVDSYLTSLRREYGVSVFDASAWCDDGDFADGHHLLRNPAERFSQRFGREAVRPWLAAGDRRPVPGLTRRSESADYGAAR